MQEVLFTMRQIAVRLVMCAAIVGLAVLGCAALSRVGANEGGPALTAYNSNNLVRLHVRASGEDALAQRIKLAVKDEVLKCTAELAEGAGSVEEATARIEDGILVIADRAQTAVGRTGAAQSVEAQLEVSRFGAAVWNGVLLPAGDYPALTVSIGGGKASNWWCVLFPPLYPIDIANTRLVQVTADGRQAKGLAMFELPAWAVRLLGLTGLYSALANK